MDNHYRYSPHDIADYTITTIADCEVRSIMRKPERFRLPLWNLFWLSTPAVDLLLEHGKSERWNRHYTFREKALPSLILEVETDPVLELKLGLHPARFLDWFRREDHDIYDSAYHELEGEVWVETVKRRAAEAATRLAGTLPPNMQGSNIYAFIQRPRDDTLRDGTSSL